MILPSEVFCLSICLPLERNWFALSIHNDFTSLCLGIIIELLSIRASPFYLSSSGVSVVARAYRQNQSFCSPRIHNAYIVILIFFLYYETPSAVYPIAMQARFFLAFFLSRFLRATERQIKLTSPSHNTKNYPRSS